MLSTELPTIFLVLACLTCVISVVALWLAAQSAAHATAMATYVEEANEKSVTLKTMAELSAEVTDLRDAYESLLQSHKKLRSKIGMREVRARRKNNADRDQDVPDPRDDPDGYKRAMRAKLGIGINK